MEHDSRTFFSEEEHDDVKGVTVLAADDGQYFLAEKWLREERDDVWIRYWITAEELAEREEAGHIVKKGKLTDEQFEAVCDKVEYSPEDAPEEVSA
jgi:hypothetical protein